MSIFGGLAMVFLIMKIMGYIDWPILWIFAPVWIPIGLMLGALILGAMGIGQGKNKDKNKPLI